MGQKMTMQQTMGFLVNSDFTYTNSVSHAVKRCLISRCFPNPDTFTHKVTSIKVHGGVKLTLHTHFADMLEEQAITHKFYFVNRSETREVVHTVGPDFPEASTELMILFDETESRDYFNFSLLDHEGMQLVVDSIVFDSLGRTVTYPFSEHRVSPLILDNVALSEIIEENGKHVARFQISFKELEEPTEVHINWETMGITYRHTSMCSKDRPHMYADLVLDDNPLVVSGDWVAIAVDDNERIIAQTIFRISTRD